jgi:hypothetical protein
MHHPHHHPDRQDEENGRVHDRNHEHGHHKGHHEGHHGHNGFHDHPHERHAHGNHGNPRHGERHDNDRLDDVEIEEARIAFEDAIRDSSMSCPELYRVCADIDSELPTINRFMGQVKLHGPSVNFINPDWSISNLASSSVFSEVENNNVMSDENLPLLSGEPEILRMADSYSESPNISMIWSSSFVASEPRFNSDLYNVMGYDFSQYDPTSMSARCIMKNSHRQTLSETCQASIFRLQNAADRFHDLKFEMESNDDGCGMLILPVLLLLLVPLAIVRIIHRHKIAKKTTKIFRVIENDPHLKAAIETASGESISSVHQDHKCIRSCSKVIFKTFVAMISFFCFFALFSILIDALDITDDDDNSSDTRDENNAIFTINPFAFFLWLGIFIFAFLVIKAVYRSNNHESNDSTHVTGRVMNWWNSSLSRQAYAPMTSTGNAPQLDDDVNVHLYEPPQIQGSTNIA